MDFDHSEQTESDSPAHGPGGLAGASTQFESAQPGPRAGGTGLGQAPAPAGYPDPQLLQTSHIPYGAPFQPGYPSSASADKPRRNWTPCYIAACLFLLLALAGAVTLAIWAGQHLGQGVFGSVFSLGMRMDELQKDVSATPIESIKSAATPASMQEVRANPADYTGKWVVLDGTLIDEPSKSQGSVSLGGASQNIEAMHYPVEPPVVILDISGNPAVAHKGDTIRAYGKGMLWDFSAIGELPFVGQAIKEGMQNDPQLQGITSVYFFFAKQVEPVPAAPAGG